jgi:hypothetical protein
MSEGTDADAGLESWTIRFGDQRPDSSDQTGGCLALRVRAGPVTLAFHRPTAQVMPLRQYFCTRRTIGVGHHLFE